MHLSMILLTVMLGQCASVLPPSVPVGHNDWISLAESLNLSSFCLQQYARMHYMVGHCVRPVCKPADATANLTLFSHFPNKTITYRDLPHWGPSSYSSPKKAVKLFSAHVIIANQSTCVKFDKCSSPQGQKLGPLKCSKFFKKMPLNYVLYSYH